jgi:cbb3-type cytochrome oxidase subunit 3
MLRDLFSTAGGIEQYGMASMVIFLVFFALLVFYALSIRKKQVEDYSRMPLEDSLKESEDNQDIK